jgi:hypothetical protein
MKVLKINDMKKVGIFVLLLLAALWSCEYETIVPKEVDLPDEPVSYSEQIAPVFVEVSCTSCHSGGIAPDLREDKSYAALINGGMINTDNPEESTLIVTINEIHGTAGNLSALQKALILRWIEEGAKDN